MSFLGIESLRQLLSQTQIISPFDGSKVKNGAYELSLGSQVFQTGCKPRKVKELAKNEKIYIDPGQFALLLTEETVNIPRNKFALISIKASAKFNGLINVSGFHVDPGFQGKLLFSVYNAGPSTIILSQGTSYFPIWFAELNESQEYVGSHNGQSIIPNEPVKALSQGDLASPNALSKRIDDVKQFKTKLEWAILATITLLVGLNIKVWTDKNELKQAVEFGYKMKSEELIQDSMKKKSNSDYENLKTRLDSFMKSKPVDTKSTSNNKKAVNI